MKKQGILKNQLIQKAQQYFINRLLSKLQGDETPRHEDSKARRSLEDAIYDS
jgi:hypothetical protein